MKTMNVLFLCTGNSARSILAEALLQHRGLGKFMAYSAGSRPRGRVHPFVLELLESLGFNTRDLRSKSWEEFTRAGAPEPDLVITVCDRAAQETCPVWPGRPVTAHWSIEDPDRPDLSETQQRHLFEKVFRELDQRIRIFASLPPEQLEELSLQNRLADIGQDPVKHAG